MFVPNSFFRVVLFKLEELVGIIAQDTEHATVVLDGIFKNSFDFIIFIVVGFFFFQKLDLVILTIGQEIFFFYEKSAWGELYHTCPAHK